MEWSRIVVAGAVVLSMASCASSGADSRSNNDATETVVEPGPERFGDPAGVDPELERQFANFMREPILLERRLPADGMRVVLARQLKLYRDVGGEYSEVVQTAEDPAVRSHAIFRRAQLFVRLGCAILASPAPNRLAEDQIDVYRGILRQQAEAPMEQAAEELKRIPSDHPLARDAGHLADLPTEKRVEAFDLYCANRADYWRHPEPFPVDEYEAARCEEGDAVACYVWSELGSGGSEAKSRACELGVHIACPGSGEAEEEEEDPPGAGIRGE